MRNRTLVLMLVLPARLVFADDLPKPISEKVVKAWESDVGARYGRSAAVRWAGSQANDPFEEKAPDAAGQLPTFTVVTRYLPKAPRTAVLADLKEAPVPDVPFALYLYEWAAHRRLLQVARFTTLESLNCSCAQISGEEFEHLTDLRNLRSLDLSLTSITWGIPSSLAKFQKLTDLSLYGTLLHDKTAGLIIEHLPQLQSLNVGATPMTDAGIAVLATHKNLRHLHIQETKITDDGLGALAALELRTLNLGRTKVTNAGMKHLGKLKTLETLLLYGTAVTDDGVRELATLDRLRLLNFHATGGIGKAGLEVVGGMKNLESLSLQVDADVPDEALHDLRGLPKLRNLHLTQTTLDDSRVARLQKVIPECKITWQRRN